MAVAESQEDAPLQDHDYDDPSQLSQLLHQRARNRHHDQFTSITSLFSADESQAIATGTGPPTPPHPHRPAREADRRVPFIPRDVPPILPKQHSAPVGVPIVREGSTRMYDSFSGAFHTPGDTQADPEMFKQFTSGLLGSKSDLAGSQVFVAPNLPPIAEPPTDNVEVVSSSSQRSDLTTSPAVLNHGFEAQNFATDAAFQTPEVAGKKRDNEGNVLSSAVHSTATPATNLTTTAFGFKDTSIGNPMSLTQAFQNTPAKTSPAGLESVGDIVFQRPSPPMHAPNSSPGMPISSPIKATGRREPFIQPAIRSSSEPRADYETMKQSQERRRSHEQENNTEDQVQDSWEQPTSAENRFWKRKAREQFDRKASESLSRVSAPVPFSSGSRRRGTSRRFPTTSRAEKSPAGDASNEPKDSDERSADDSDDDLSQPVSTLDESPEVTQEDSANATAGHRVQVPHTSSHPLHVLSGGSALSMSQPATPMSQLQRESQSRFTASQPQLQVTRNLHSSRELEIVMDSQPMAANATFNLPQPDALRYPSSPSVNQYSINQTTMAAKTGLTSFVIPSSIPPMPPKSSPREIDGVTGQGETEKQPEEGVPSSPPIVDQDEDITYDEHAYDEGSDHNDEDMDSDVDSGHENEHDEQDDNGLPELLGPDADKTDAAAESDGQLEDDEEIPETMEVETFEEEKEAINLSHPADNSAHVPTTSMGPPYLPKRSTVSKTALLEDTQPTFIPEPQSSPRAAAVADESTEIPSDSEEESSAQYDDRYPDDEIYGCRDEGRRFSVDDVYGCKDEDGMAAFNARHGIRASSTPPQPEEKSIENVQGGQNTPSPGEMNARSLHDIAGLPDTQQSVDAAEIDIPQLSFTADSDHILEVIKNHASPVRPAKKRRTTYASKNVLRGPVPDTDPTDELSTSPAKEVRSRSVWSPPETQNPEIRASTVVITREPTDVFNQAAAKANPQFHSNEPQPSRKGSLKPVNRALLNKSLSKTPPKKTREGQATGPTKPIRSIQTYDNDVEMHDADHTNAGGDNQTSTETTDEQRDQTGAGQDIEHPSGELVVPNRVFAFWPNDNKYYPATCIGSENPHRFMVRYDDGNEFSVESTQVRALELRPGDHVKVDRNGMKQHIYVVLGLKGKTFSGEPTVKFPLTDRYGYGSAVLEEKRRDSLPAIQEHTKKRIVVAVEELYLTSALWTRLKDRSFQYTSSVAPSVTASPASTVALPTTSIDTPYSVRRSLHGSMIRASSVSSSTRPTGYAFRNMAFAITLTNEGEKSGIETLITANGGRVVGDGFQTMFDVTSFDAPISSQDSPDAESLSLKREYAELGFVAVISDLHSRRPKYVQGLALNVPCLHSRWVDDSISASHALPFAKYLLPAGTSTFLDPQGVVLSRSILPYDPSGDDVSFATTVQQRTSFFRNQSILFIMGKNKKGAEPFIFFAHAMGATHVGQCADIVAAKQSLKRESGWDWIFMGNKAGGIDDAAAKILGLSRNSDASLTSTGSMSKKKAGGETKRKRGEAVEAESLVRTGVVKGRKVRVMCGEFMIQSLILGALVSE